MNLRTRFYVAAVFVTVGTALRLVLASEAETGRARRGATLAPEPKQSVGRVTVVDCKALELLYKSCGFRICLTAMTLWERVVVDDSTTWSASTSSSIPMEGASRTPNGRFWGSLGHAAPPRAINLVNSEMHV